jgi:hypothetical protein
LESLGSLGTSARPSSSQQQRPGPQPDVIRYAQVLGRTSYTVVRVGPVLAELDTLKTGAQQTRHAKEVPQGQRAEQGSGVVGQLPWVACYPARPRQADQRA